MGVPAHLMTTLFTRVRPAETTDGYGNTTRDYGMTASRATAYGWHDPNGRTEPPGAGRDALVSTDLLITNYADIQGRDRIEIGATVYEIEGQPKAIPTPAGTHHYELDLKAVSG